VFTFNYTKEDTINNTYIKIYPLDYVFINKNISIKIILDDNNKYYPLKSYYKLNITVITDKDSMSLPNNTNNDSNSSTNTYLKARI
jgi:hypothetical protein